MSITRTRTMPAAVASPCGHDDPLVCWQQGHQPPRLAADELATPLARLLVLDTLCYATAHGLQAGSSGVVDVHNPRLWLGLSETLQTAMAELERAGQRLDHD